MVNYAVDIFKKLTILTDAAKYDAACTSSGMQRDGAKGALGNASACGICHTFAADGRCVSLLKVLMTNACIYDCKYCVNRRSNDVRRAAFTPRELAELTVAFYRRNYIEGLFLSSGVQRSPDYTCEQMLEVLTILRGEFNFRGYIHIKAIPGADSRLISALATLADRISVNIELPSEQSLGVLAPDKTKESILRPMKLISSGISQSKELIKYRSAPKFAPAGQSTQMIVGASGESDLHILNLTQALYKKFSLKRVFFSAYVPVMSDALLPSVDTKPPLLREHRLYQADWLLRFYGFDASELLDEKQPNFNPYLDPKCNWALNHMEFFPIEVNRASLEELLRVPGIGVKSARRIVFARRSGSLSFDALKRMGVVLKRAQYFITCRGRIMDGLKFSHASVFRALAGEERSRAFFDGTSEQLSFFENPRLTREEVVGCITGQI